MKKPFGSEAQLECQSSNQRREIRAQQIVRAPVRRQLVFMPQFEVDSVGWATAICYGFFIPCFLGFLFAKQNVVMRKVKTVVMQTAGNEAKVTVRLQGPKSEESEKDLSRRSDGQSVQRLPSHAITRWIQNPQNIQR